MRWPLFVALISLSNAVALGQSVISVHSGLINYSEGAVFIDNQPVTQKLGKYPALREYSDLLTQDGRAEIQLAPEVYLRVGMNSGVRMISNNLADTQIQLLSGSVIFDSGNAKGGSPITLIAGDSRIRVETPIRMRIDVDPPQLRVEKGEAVVIRGTERDGKATKVSSGQMLGLTGASVVRRMTDGEDDALDLWSQQRNRLIYLSLANDRNILDPGAADWGSGDPDLGAWLGYIPSAAILPLTSSYGSVIMPGYGYYYPWSALSYYVPVYGRYPAGYGRVTGVSGFSVGSGFRPVPGYRFTPTYPGSGGAFVPRPVGGIRVGAPAGSGTFAPRPAVPRPIAPRAPVHR